MSIRRHATPSPLSVHGQAANGGSRMSVQAHPNVGLMACAPSPQTQGT